MQGRANSTSFASSNAPIRHQEAGLPRCSNCGSDSLKKFSVIHAAGLSHQKGSVTGVGMSLGGSLGVGVGSTKSVSQTVLSAAAQPPVPKKISYWSYAGVFFGISWLIAGISTIGEAQGGSIPLVVLGFAVLVASAMHIYRARKYNSNELPSALLKWDRSFMCERCGNIMTL